MKNLGMIIFSLAFNILLAASYAHAQASACPDGIVNVVDLGANGSAAADTAAFSAAYTAVTTAGGQCEGDRIYVPAGNWAGHWPPFYYSVYIQGAGAGTTNFMGDNSTWPIFWAFAPITFDSFGFWGSPNVNIRLDGGSTTSVLENLLCRSSSGMFIYDTINQDVHWENIQAISCGNTTSSPSWMGASVVIYGANNIYMDSPTFMAEPNMAIVAVNTPSVIIYGGGINNEFVANSNSPLIYAIASSLWTTDFSFGGITSYDIALASESFYSASLTTFGAGAKGFSTPGSASIICSDCNFQ